MGPSEAQLRLEKCLAVVGILASVLVTSAACDAVIPESKSETLDEALTFCNTLEPQQALECRDAALEVDWK